MNKRPLVVTIVGWLFIATGVLGIGYHASELKADFLSDTSVLLTIFVRLLAIVGGAFLLRRANWARWLLIAWIAYHAILSAYHSPLELALHVAFLIILAVLLFSQSSRAYFSQSTQ